MTEKLAFPWEVIEPDGSATARFAVREDAEDYCEYLATIGIAAKVRELPGFDDADDYCERLAATGATAQTEAWWDAASV